MFFSVQFDTDNWWTIGGDSYSSSYVSVTHILTVSSSDWGFKIQGVYKLSEDFAKLYFHKYWTEIHDVTTIWKRNVCSFIVTLNAFDVCPTCDTAHVQAILPFPPNPLKHVLCDMSHVGRTSNAFKVTMKLQTFLFQMVVTSCISVQYLWKYGFAKSSDNLYAPCSNVLWDGVIPMHGPQPGGPVLYNRVCCTRNVLHLTPPLRLVQHDDLLVGLVGTLLLA